MSNPNDVLISHPEQAQYRLIAEFAEGHNREVAKLRESDFVKGVLGFLVHPDPAKRSLTQWIKHAGHITNEIDVTDNTGTVLYRCPAPLFHPHTRTFEERKGTPPIDVVVNNAVLHDQRMPGLGSKMLVEEISSLIKPQSELEIFQSRWNEVLARYGLPPITGSKAAEETVAAQVVVAEESKPRYTDEDEEL